MSTKSAKKKLRMIVGRIFANISNDVMETDPISVIALSNIIMQTLDIIDSRTVKSYLRAMVVHGYATQETEGRNALYIIYRAPIHIINGMRNINEMTQMQVMR